MHPRTTELLDYLDAQHELLRHELLRSTFDSVPPERRGQRPSANQWSANDTIAQIVAPERVDPRQTGDALEWSDLEWSDYEAARHSMKGVLLANDDLALGDLSHPHPVFGPLNLYTWFAFIAAHATRHAAQIREAAESTGPARAPRAS